MTNKGKSIDGIKGNAVNTDNVHGGKTDINLDEMNSLSVDNPEDVIVKKKGYVREKGAK